MTRKLSTVRLLAITLATLALTSPRARANYDACDKCDIAAMYEDYKRDSKKSIELAEEAAGKFGDAADAYGGALSDAQGLAEGLVPSIPTDLGGCIDAVTGKFGTAMQALSGLWKLGLASGAEKEAADIMASSNYYWKAALRAKKCIEDCCKARDQAPSLVPENPDVDFKQMVEHTALRQCLDRLSEGDRKSLLADANAGRLDGKMHKDNVAAIKSMVNSSGGLHK